MTTHDSHAQGAHCWADLMTDDAEAARRFYASLLGWTYEVGGPESGFYAMAKKDGAQVAGIGGKPPGSPYPTAWTTYVTVDDVDATCAKIKDAGGGVMMGPMQVMDAGKMAVVTDPTGGVFGLWQAGQHRGAQLTDAPGAMAWRELNTRDLPKARDFLVKVFGYETREMPGMAYETLHLGKDTVGGVLQMDDKWPAELPPHWMVYFAVEDVDAAVKQVGELGGKVMVPPFDTPYGKIAVVQDPQGGTFSAIQLAPNPPA